MTKLIDEIANARLIAAAPDMLEALREAAEVLDWSESSIADLREEILPLLRAAISKATNMTKLIDETTREPACIIDGHHGVYVPQIFATEYGTLFEGGGRVPADVQIDRRPAEEREVLLAGPEHEHYWDVWEAILDGLEWTEHNGTCRRTLWQDSDLFLITNGIMGELSEFEGIDG